MATSNIICRYHKAGVCANGRRCKFSHDLSGAELSKPPGSIPIQCKYYKQKACTLGNRCAYLHGQPPQQQQRPQPVARAAPPSAPRPRAAEAAPVPAAPAAPARAAEPTIDELWGFEDGDHGGNVGSGGGSRGGGGYFYGAPGGFVEERETRRPVFSYRDALRQGVAEEQLPEDFSHEPSQEAAGKQRMKTNRICIYHAQGVCRYGVLCRHLHDIPADLLDNPDRPEEERLRLDEEERELSATAECGICYEPVKGLFGLLNNCNHAFCLSCMREWRAKGREHMHKETVRQCPICRTESFVVIPSARLVVDPVRKAKLVEMYKATLSTIKCKYFEYGQTSCPFGTSCFYAHVMPDGSLAEAPRLRYAVGESGTRIVTAPRIIDFLENRP